MHRITQILTSISPILVLLTAELAADFKTLGYLSEDLNQSWASGVSADGKVVVGQSVSGGSFENPLFEAFRWTEESGMVGLGLLNSGDTESSASAVSGDGSVVVGSSLNKDDPISSEAFRWTSETGMVGLGDFDGGNFYSSGQGVSDDGSVVVGGGSPLNQYLGFRWTSEDGMVSIGDLPGGIVQSNAWAASFDGSVVVGSSYIFQADRVIRWTSAGLEDLGNLPGGINTGVAWGVTPDGSVLVGHSWGANNTEAFRWTAETGMVGIGSLRDDAGSYSQAYDVTADGRTVIGQTSSLDTESGYEAFIWDATNGMRSLREELETVHGLNLDGFMLDVATGISDDGSVIVGRGTSSTYIQEAWRVEITPVSVVVPPITTLEFSGPLLMKEDSTGTATYSGVAVDSIMSGKLTIGATDAGSVPDGPDTFLFGGSKYFGTLLGNSIETTTEGSADPLEVRFSDDTLITEDDLDLINLILGTELPLGTALDLAEIETRVTEGNRVIEFGVSFFSRDLNLIDGSSYRAFPSLDEVDAAVYFVVESVNGEEIYNAIGTLSDFFPAPTDITVTTTRLVATRFEIDFISIPGLTGWRVRGDDNPGGSFPDDLTAVTTTTIGEDPSVPGKYTASIELPAGTSPYFVRIER